MKSSLLNRGTVLILLRDVLVLEDRSCGVCGACLVGAPYWCTASREHGETLLTVPPNIAPEFAMSVLTAMSAVIAAQLAPQFTVLVLSPTDHEVIARFISLIHPGPIVSATQARDPQVRRQLADLTSTGRADAVVALQDGREAVKAVIRGGIVCLSDNALRCPSITELVQREVSLVGPQNLEETVRRAGRGVLEHLLATV